jgi:hypothetical protein
MEKQPARKPAWHQKTVLRPIGLLDVNVVTAFMKIVLENNGVKLAKRLDSRLTEESLEGNSGWKEQQASTGPGGNWLTTPHKNLFAFSFFQIPHKPVFVLPQIFRGSLNLTMAGGFIHLANYKAQDVFLQRFCGLLLERLQVAHGDRSFDTAASRNCRQIGFACCRAGFTDSRSAIDLIVKDKNSQVRRVQVSQSRQIIKRE